MKERKNQLTAQDRWLMPLFTALFLIVGLAVTALLTMLLLSGDGSLSLLVWVIAMCILADGYCFGFAYFVIAYMGMRFTVDGEGVGVRYPFLRRRVIPWTELQQVCICNEIIHARNFHTGRPVICFVKKGEKEGFFGRWKMRSIFHLFGVVTIDYTEENVDLVKTHCPFAIVDIRHRFDYRIDI